MLVVLVPFVAGILLAEYFVVPLYLAVALFLISVIVAYLSMPRRVVWAYVAFALLAFGYVVAELRQPSAAVPYGAEHEMIIDVERPS